MLAYLNKAYLAGHMYLSKHSVYAKKHDATYSKAGDFMFHFREYKAPFLEGADHLDNCYSVLWKAFSISDQSGLSHTFSSCAR